MPLIIGGLRCFHIIKYDDVIGRRLWCTISRLPSPLQFDSIELALRPRWWININTATKRDACGDCRSMIVLACTAHHFDAYVMLAILARLLIKYRKSREMIFTNVRRAPGDGSLPSCVANQFHFKPAKLHESQSHFAAWRDVMAFSSVSAEGFTPEAWSASSCSLATGCIIIIAGMHYFRPSGIFNIIDIIYLRLRRFSSLAIAGDASVKAASVPHEWNRNISRGSPSRL